MNSKKTRSTGLCYVLGDRLRGDEIKRIEAAGLYYYEICEDGCGPLCLKKRAWINNVGAVICSISLDEFSDEPDKIVIYDFDEFVDDKDIVKWIDSIDKDDTLYPDKMDFYNKINKILSE